jgi:hypothetical protein
MTECLKTVILLLFLTAHIFPFTPFSTRTDTYLTCLCVALVEYLLTLNINGFVHSGKTCFKFDALKGPDVLKSIIFCHVSHILVMKFMFQKIGKPLNLERQLHSIM